MVNLSGRWILNRNIRPPIMIDVVNCHNGPVAPAEQFAGGEPVPAPKIRRRSGSLSGEGQQIDLTVVALRYDFRVAVSVEIASTAYLPIITDEQSHS
jgi:hypothetical protein